MFGAAGGFAANINLATLNGANGFSISGALANDLFGYSVSVAGDINGDGFEDIVIGSPGQDGGGSNAGAAYVVFGAAGGFGANLNLSTLNGANGFRLTGAAAGNKAGFAVHAAGDFNGDGFDDVIVGAADPYAAGPGAAYVVFGRASGFAATLSLGALNGNNGFRLNGAAGDSAGLGVSRAGDVNGDGFDDIIVGAPTAAGNTGATYVVFGGKPGQAVTRTGTAIANKIQGGDFADTLNGLAGNDTLIGWSGADTLNGGAGADTLDGGGGADTMIGGTENDIYIVNLAGDITTESSALGGSDLVKSSVTRTLGANLEKLILTGGAAINGTGNTLANVITGNGLANTLSGLNGADKLIGGAGGDRLIGGLGHDILTGNSGADKFIFNSAPSAANRDTITDYNVTADTIQIENAAFVGIGAAGVLAAAAFHIGASAADASDRIIYNFATGALYFDADGMGGAAQIQFATLDPGLALTAAEFVVF